MALQLIGLCAQLVLASASVLAPAPVLHPSFPPTDCLEAAIAAAQPLPPQRAIACCVSWSCGQVYGAYGDAGVLGCLQSLQAVGQAAAQIEANYVRALARLGVEPARFWQHRGVPPAKVAACSNARVAELLAARAGYPLQVAHAAQALATHCSAEALLGEMLAALDLREAAPAGD